MRALAASIAVHVLVLLWLSPAHEHEVAPHAQMSATVEPRGSEAPIDVVMLDEPTVRAGGASGGGAAVPSRAARHARVHDGWEQVSIHDEGRQGLGAGDGSAGGRGRGIGFGDGGGIGGPLDVPPVPVPPAPKVSKARPPKLIWPNRDLDVIDESYLFTAKVTVDRDGSVAGARMVTTRPGSRGDRAADAIWSFRYAPALDDDGNPIRATIEQSFQVR